MRIVQLCAAVILLIAALTGASTAQQATPTTTPDDGTPDEVELVVDPEVSVVDWSYRNGTFHITFYSEVYREVSLIGLPGDAGGRSTGTVEARVPYLQPDTRTEVSIPVPRSGGEATVWISTAASLDEGKVHYLSTEQSDDLLDGPPSEDDIRDALLGGGAGTAVGALLVLVRRRFAVTRGARREA